MYAPNTLAVNEEKTWLNCLPASPLEIMIGTIIFYAGIIFSGDKFLLKYILTTRKNQYPPFLLYFFFFQRSHSLASFKCLYKILITCFKPSLKHFVGHVSFWAPFGWGKEKHGTNSICLCTDCILSKIGKQAADI